LNLVSGMDVLAQSSGPYLWANLAFSLILVAPAVRILRNLSFKNADNPVIRALVRGDGGKQLVAALEFLKALQEFEGEDRNGTNQATSS
jgi:hypothetical protein